MTKTKRQRSIRSLTAAGFLLASLCSHAALAQSSRADWDQRYERAREQLVSGHEAQAEPVFARLAQDAPTPEDARLAGELAKICRSKLSVQTDAAHLRGQEEMTVLYATAFVYGLGTSAWVALMTEPKNLGAAVLPFALLTTASVGGVALADSYHPFRRGVPQSIASGIYLGFGEGIWAVGLEHAGATRRNDGSRWNSAQVASALWGGATLGAIGGGLIGAVRQPTPGRVSFTLSTSLWGGLVSSFAATALSPNEQRRTEHAFGAGWIGYNVGLASGIIFAPSVAPSIARVRFVDLGGIGGGLIGAGISTFAAEQGRTRASFGASAIGAAAGLGLTWWATSGMPSDPPTQNTPALALMPSLVRTPNGWLAMVSGQL
ncbi:MAG TPA: hypothetical protein VIK01_06750 [Polyangiaceae bacterium]